MSFLQGIFGSNNNKAPAATGMPLQTSCYGKPIPIVCGTTRIGCNLVDYENFNSSNGGGSGKSGVAGGGGKGGGSTTYQYNADLVLALCEGPVNAIGNATGGVWASQTEETLSDAGSQRAQRRLQPILAERLPLRRNRLRGRAAGLTRRERQPAQLQL